ncbi:hypothetical protein DET54_11440 [Paenibacillus pabuli]|uniref:Uncharacterized protein n=1 Tax=Paenibacillus pabuli TaxID=1472 RepID=A0ABX9BET9_9BACL|nr:hypothetical protein [Paenibacillus pabuli]RAI89572.1 hypothetical protein DET54_11440 [Paenibacillus pabuli]
MTKDEIIKAVESGEFIEDHNYQCFADLNGTEGRRYLESKGFEVVRNLEMGCNGIAITTCGIHLSTNGYIYKKL